MNIFSLKKSLPILEINEEIHFLGKLKIFK